MEQTINCLILSFCIGMSRKLPPYSEIADVNMKKASHGCGRSSHAGCIKFTHVKIAVAETWSRQEELEKGPKEKGAQVNIINGRRTIGLL